MSGDEADFILHLFEAGQSLSLLLPAAAIAAGNLGVETVRLQGGGEDLDEVGSLLARRLHGGVWGTDHSQFSRLEGMPQ